MSSVNLTIEYYNGCRVKHPLCCESNTFLFLPPGTINNLVAICSWFSAADHCSQDTDGKPTWLFNCALTTNKM